MQAHNPWSLLSFPSVNLLFFFCSPHLLTIPLTLASEVPPGKPFPEGALA